MKKRTIFTEGAIFQDNYGYAEIIKVYKPGTREFRDIVAEYGLLTKFGEKVKSTIVHYKYSQNRDFSFAIGKWQLLTTFKHKFKLWTL